MTQTADHGKSIRNRRKQKKLNRLNILIRTLSKKTTTKKTTTESKALESDNNMH